MAKIRDNPKRKKEVVDMCGYGRGWHRWQPKVTAPSGYTYIGPCRCGRGPHAFYQDPNGRIVHAWQLYCWGVPTTPTKEDLKVELEALKEEKAQLEKRIEELEKQVDEKKE
ncbi:MAG: hypothetical protein NC827_05550 [Candidatus Omnitrophica bacterium]|nr:hypothetical protein [Candidatus Omnitrophota bacterium]MCM8802755.1 hypothetical protein [Candidatus Omnitrophota bacterium]